MSDIIQIRTAQNTQDRFRKLAADAGLSQGAIFEQMLTAWESEDLSQRYPDRKTDLEKLSNALTLIQNLYNVAVQDGKLQAETAKQKVQARLESKEQTIIQLQAELDNMKAKVKDNAYLRDKAMEATKRADDLLQQNIALMEINSDLKRKAAEAEKLEELEKEVVALQASLKAKDETIDILRSVAAAKQVTEQADIAK